MGNKVSLEENLIELRIVSKQVRCRRRTRSLSRALDPSTTTDTVDSIAIAHRPACMPRTNLRFFSDFFLGQMIRSSKKCEKNEKEALKKLKKVR